MRVSHYYRRRGVFEGLLKGGVIAVDLGNGCAEAIFFSYISIIIIQMDLGLFCFFHILNWLYLLKTALLYLIYVLSHLAPLFIRSNSGLDWPRKSRTP